MRAILLASATATSLKGFFSISFFAHTRNGSVWGWQFMSKNRGALPGPGAQTGSVEFSLTQPNDSMIGIASRFVRMNGWTEAQIAGLRTAATTGDAKIDALTSVVREAAPNSGKRHRCHVEGRSTSRLER